MPLLEAHELVKSYNGRRVVDRVSFTVEAGEIVGLLGRNGAGKTTSFRMAIGMITPEGGKVRFDAMSRICPCTCTHKRAWATSRRSRVSSSG